MIQIKQAENGYIVRQKYTGDKETLVVVEDAKSDAETIQQLLYAVVEMIDSNICRLKVDPHLEITVCRAEGMEEPPPVKEVKNVIRKKATS